MLHHPMKPKAGDCVVLLRNPKQGLLSGTRLVVKALHQKVKLLSFLKLTTNYVKAVIYNFRMMISKL
jgi:hypothetical protein